MITNENVLFSIDFGLRNRMCRSRMSISSNCSREFEPESAKNFIRYLYIAKTLLEN